MKTKLPRHQNASDRLIKDLIFKARQCKMWAAYFKLQSRVGESKIQLKKSQQAAKALKTLAAHGAKAASEQIIPLGILEQLGQNLMDGNVFHAHAPANCFQKLSRNNYLTFKY